MAALALMCVATINCFAQEAGNCIDSDEAELLQLVDEYRLDNGLSTVPWSQSLMTVAQWHAIDATANGDTIFTSSCNLHSWSEPDSGLWNGGCYTADHANASLMWYKPIEITGGVYTALAFENAAYGFSSVAAALNGWKGSAGHNNVILNKSVWASYTWTAMGVGVDLQSRYYYLWFSNMVDPLGDMPLCQGDGAIFSDGFD